MRKKCDFNDFERGMDVGASLATPEPRLQCAEDKKLDIIRLEKRCLV